MAKPEIHQTPPGQLGKSLILSQRRYGRTAKVTKPEDLPLGWEDLICEMMAEGCSQVEVRAELDMHYKLWVAWVKDWPAFREVVERGIDLEEAWWLKAGRENLGNKYFNAPLYSYSMAARFSHNHKKQYQIESQRNARDNQAEDSQEDKSLEDLFSGGDGMPQQRQKQPAPRADDAEFKEVK